MASNLEQSNRHTKGDDQLTTALSELMNSSPSVASTSVLFDALANHRRRYVLRFLIEHETPVALGDLADNIAAWETDEPLTEIPADDITQIRTSLHHTHIPKLAEIGLLEYNPAKETVMVLENAKQLDHIMTE